ncbi:hypothetical protein AB4Z54_54385, partial [Streptomyces sp. MCAF7]
GQPLPVAVREQSAPTAWPPRIPSQRTRRNPLYPSPPSAPPTEWVVAGPLVRAYVVLDEERRHALSLRWAWVERPPARKG